MMPYLQEYFRNVISDTGTSLIGGPEVFVDYMAKSVGAIGPDAYVSLSY